MNNKSEILMIGPDINSQGGISSVIRFYRDFWFSDNTFLNLSSYKDGNIFAKLLFYGVFLIKYIFTLLTERDISLVHIHTASRGSFLRKSIVFNLAKFFNKKVLIHVHGAEFPIFYRKSPNFIKKIITNIFNKADLILVLSEQWRKNISSISANDNIKVLYNPTIIKKLNHAESKTIKVLFLGRLGKRKGVYDIIEAAKHLKNNNVKIMLYGDGEVDQIQKLIDENNLNNKIKLGGWIKGDDVDKAYREAAIYILPSYNEGLPMSILEAISYGLPVISTPVGGTPEAVKDKVNGFLIQPGDYKALAEKIDLLAGDKKLRDQLGRESYRIAKEKFDIKIILKQLRDVYNKLK